MTSPLAITTLVCAGLATLILLGSLTRRRPSPDWSSKLWLLFGLGVFPIGAAAAGNVAGYQATKERRFCGSCHVMSLHLADAEDPQSRSLAARHARNPFFGDENCYVCHADYGMYGTIVTKLGGMRHVWLYYTKYEWIPVDEALKTIHLVKPYSNANCMQCHSTRADLWLSIADHAASLDDVRANRVSCASVGCHGYAHPFDKRTFGADRTLAEDAGARALDAGPR